MKAHRVFFGLALVQGVASLFLWTLAPLTEAATWHVHELVFGFSLAAVGGFLLTRVPTHWIAAIAALWLAARVAHVLPGAGEAPRAMLSAAATAAIAFPAAGMFLRGAKQASNLVFPALMFGLVLADALHLAGVLAWLPSPAGSWLGLGLVILLIAAMGGRVVGAAASGASQRGGGPRIAPVPWLDASALVAVAAGFVLVILDGPSVAVSVALGSGGALLAIRPVRWLPGLRRSGGDMQALALGQAWLAIGLLGYAILTALPGSITPSSALHLATVGGIGGTVMVMAMRASAQREGRAMPGRLALLVAVFASGAGVLRAFGSPMLHQWSAAAWSVASGIALWSALQLRGRGRERRVGMLRREDGGTLT